MLWFLLRRLGLLVIALAVASVIVFLLLRVVPGDLARNIAGLEASEEQVATIRERLGLDRPLATQYFEWIGGVVQGDLGESALTRSSVTSQLGEKLMITAPLVAASTILSIAVSLPLGMYAAMRHRRADGLAVSAASQVGFAVPQFLVGILLIAALSGKFDLPSQGFPRKGWSDDWGRSIRSMVLPTLTLASAQTAVLVRFVRTSTLEVMNQDYIRTARAKGLTRWEALLRHGMRNASVPVISVVGIQIASLLAGVVVIERVFNLPGVGQMLLRDISNRDMDKVQGTVLLLVAAVLVIGFLVDVIHHLVDPRLRVTR